MKQGIAPAEIGVCLVCALLVSGCGDKQQSETVSDTSQDKEVVQPIDDNAELEDVNSEPDKPEVQVAAWQPVVDVQPVHVEAVQVEESEITEAEPEPVSKVRNTYNPQVPASGTWSGLIQWPHVPVHIANLPDGQLLTWASFSPESWEPSPGNYTVSAVYNPQNGAFLRTDNYRHDMFCAGISLLEDGSILASGGNRDPLQTNTSRFNLQTLRWDETSPMNSPRWYGTTVTLGNGDIFATFAEGADDFGEIYNPQSDSWLNLPGTDMSTLRVEEALVDAESGDGNAAQWYAYMHVTPDGKVFHPGPTETMHLFSTDGAGMVEELGPRPGEQRHLQFGTSTSYAPGKILVTGGADLRKAGSGASTSEAMVVDLSGTSPAPRKIASMKRSRTFHDAVTLANGEVMIIGGNGEGYIFSDAQSRMVSEIFDPATETWRDAPAISVPRNYHSIALLMKDARVISAGGGLCGSCSVNHPDAQIYTPGYLYNSDGSLAERPQITAIESQAVAGGDVKIHTNTDAYRFTMVRLSAVTHSVNMDQRFIDIEYDIDADGYTLHLEDNPNVLIPGNYWIFAFNEQGVPSVGETLQIKTEI